MSGYFSLGASVESRIIQSQESKSAGEKMTRKKKREEISPRVDFDNNGFLDFIMTSGN